MQKQPFTFSTIHQTYVSARVASLRIGDSVARACEHVFVFAVVLALNAASLAASRERLCLAPTFVKIR